jgi:hypothetical protein
MTSRAVLQLRESPRTGALTGLFRTTLELSPCKEWPRRLLIPMSAPNEVVRLPAACLLSTHSLKKIVYGQAELQNATVEQRRTVSSARADPRGAPSTEV